MCMLEERIETPKKIVVYTVIMGDYDYLKDPEYIMENCDYICFTNNPNLKSDIWQIRYDADTQLDNTKWQRRHKVMVHEYLPEYDWSIYVDGNVRIIGDLRKYIEEESKGAPMLCLKHPDRDNAYDEAEECIKLRKDNPEIIRKQMEDYRKEGYEADNGLAVTNVLVRKHMEPQIINLMELWWKEIETKSRRDQLSFNYVCWKADFKYDVSEMKCWKSKYWLNPGIHTSDIKKCEYELIEHLQLEAYMQYLLQEREKYIVLKERELEDVNTQLGWKKQKLEDANTQLGWKKQELEDANTQLGWKKQELEDANTQLGWKKQELEDANTQLGWKKQELEDANTQLGWKEEELERINKKLQKCKAEKEELQSRLKDVYASTSWKCTKILRDIKGCVKRK